MEENIAGGKIVVVTCDKILTACLARLDSAFEAARSLDERAQ
jgi:hypothetical protein